MSGALQKPEDQNESTNDVELKNTGGHPELGGEAKCIKNNPDSKPLPLSIYCYTERSEQNRTNSIKQQSERGRRG